jgi:E1A-binding protein p400
LTPSGKRLAVLRGDQKLKAASPANTGSLLKQPLADALVKQLKNQSHLMPSTSTTINLTGNTRYEEELAQRTKSEFFVAEKEEMRKQQRTYSLQLLAKVNQRRCDAAPIFGSDLRDSVSEVLIQDLRLTSSVMASTSFTCRSYISCQKTLFNHNYYREWCLGKTIRQFDERVVELEKVFRNFVLFVPAVCAPLPNLHVSHPNPSKVNVEMAQQTVMKAALSPTMKLLHPIVSAMSTQVIKNIYFGLPLLICVLMRMFVSFLVPRPATDSVRLW